jgi:aryl-alcohol dehydrogenase-like predicted oxidoreductase
MLRRRLGENGPEVPILGLGCMGMSEFYGLRDDAESEATIRRAVELGAGFLDTADMYGIGKNERLMGRAIKGIRGRVFLATKFGNVRDKDGGFIGVDGRPEYVRSACEASLRRLGVDVIDLYYQHRVDPRTPRAVRPVKSRWRGFWPKGRTSFPSPAPEAANTLKRT